MKLFRICRYLDGSWYIYYAAAPNADDNEHRLYVLKGGSDENDPSTGPYEYVGPLTPQNADFWAVDGSVLEVNSERYLVFSGAPVVDPWSQVSEISLCLDA